MSDDATVRALKVLESLNLPRTTARSTSLPTEFAQFTLEHVFGNLWARPGLALRDRSLATITILAATGRDSQLRYHLRGALHLGFTRDELEELFLHVAHYAGWPLGINAQAALTEVVNALANESDSNTAASSA